MKKEMRRKVIVITVSNLLNQRKKEHLIIANIKTMNKIITITPAIKLIHMKMTLKMIVNLVVAGRKVVKTRKPLLNKSSKIINT